MMPLSRVKYRRQIPGASAVALIPDLVERTSNLIRSGYSFPRWWEVYKLNAPKVVMRMGPLEEVKLPFDKLVKTAVRKIPMLRKEHIEFSDTNFVPIAVRFAQTQHALMKDKNMTEEEAFAECEDKIFKEELFAFAKNIRRTPGSYFKLTDKESEFFRLHDYLNAQVYADGATKTGHGNTDASGTDYKSALNALYNSPVASPMRALALKNPRPYLAKLLSAYQAALADPTSAAAAEVLGHYKTTAALAAATERLNAVLASGDITAATLAAVEGERDSMSRVIAKAADGSLYRKVDYPVRRPSYAESGGVPAGPVLTEFVDGLNRDQAVSRLPSFPYTERQRYVKGAHTLPLDTLIEVIHQQEAVHPEDPPFFDPALDDWSPEMLREAVYVGQDDIAQAKARTLLNEARAISAGLPPGSDTVNLPPEPEDNLMYQPARDGALEHMKMTMEMRIVEAYELLDRLAESYDQAQMQLILAGIDASDETLDSNPMLRMELDVAIENCVNLLTACDAVMNDMDGEGIVRKDYVEPESSADLDDSKARYYSRAISYREHVWHSEILRYKQKVNEKAAARESMHAELKRQEELARQHEDAQRKAAAEAATAAAAEAAAAAAAAESAQAAPAAAPSA